MKFTGERVVPGQMDGNVSWVLQDHIARYNFALDKIAGKDVLDLGCGVGYGSYIMSLIAKTVDGIDVSFEAISEANSLYKRDNNCFYCNDITKLESLKTYDAIVSFEFIEHINPDIFFDVVYKSINKDGVLIVSSPINLFGPGTKPSNNFHVFEWTTKEFIDNICLHFLNAEFYLQEGVNFYRDDLLKIPSVIKNPLLYGIAVCRGIK